MPIKRAKRSNTLNQPVFEIARTPAGRVNHKTNRLRYIRAGAAAVLSKALRKNYEARDVSFIDNHKKGYRWFLSISTVFNKRTRGRVTTEYELPNWTKQQMWRWKSHESERMIDWLNRRLLKAEKVGDGDGIIGRKQIDDNAGIKELEATHEEKDFLKEVCIVVYTKKEQKDLKNRWQRPEATIKEPASEFIAWMTGSTDRDIAQKMDQQYLGVDDRDNEGSLQGVGVPYGGFGGGPVVTDIPTAEDIAKQLAEQALAQMLALHTLQ
ncbi:hypothetical protein TWF281_006588 [Arthrobotrys megalospora]